MSCLLSGYPKNKCDKYIKALIEHGLVRREDGKNGHSKYYPSNSYLYLWYGVLFTAVPNADGSFEEETFRAFLDYFSRTVLKNFYRQLCIHWLKNNLRHEMHCYIHTDNLSLYDVEIGGVCLDFAYVSDRGYYAYFDSVLGEGLTGRALGGNGLGHYPESTLLQKRVLPSHREPSAGQLLEPQ